MDIDQFLDELLTPLELDTALTSSFDIIPTSEDIAAPMTACSSLKLTLFVCQHPDCHKVFKSAQGRNIHFGRAHGKKLQLSNQFQNLATSAEKLTFKTQFLIALYEILGKSRKANNQCNQICHRRKCKVQCESRVFLSLFSSLPSFKSKSNGQMSISFKGIAGKDRAEAIFGKDFWKFTFPTRHYNYVQFWNPNDISRPCKMKLTLSPKETQNCFPVIQLPSSEISCTFRMRRDKRSAQQQANAQIMTIPE